MLLSFNWLKSWCDTNLDIKQISHMLTMAGLEVENCTPVAPSFSNVVVSKVIKLDQHPNADRLKVAMVDIGEQKPVQIVCGAPNITLNAKVPCAKIGAKLPGNIVIKEAKLRGVDSSGMLCSGKELGIDNGTDGLLILDDDVKVGKNIREVLDLDDQVLEIKSTPNRADCLSIKGIAREVAVLTDCSLVPVLASIPEEYNSDDAYSPRAKVIASQACGRLLICRIQNVDNHRSTPLWMKNRLLHSGIASHSFLVDVSNYVMLELGQPIHIYDAKQIKNTLHARYAKDKEIITCLNDKTIALEKDTLVIADDNGPISVAGIIGSQSTAVNEDSYDIVIESAYFAPKSIIGKAKRYGLNTEASYRFERGVDYAQQKEAIQRACQLILEYAGGEIVTTSEALGKLPCPQHISLRLDRVNKVLGISPTKKQIGYWLTKLGFKPQEKNQEFLITTPSFRFDIHQEIDLIEEIARLYGYDHIIPQAMKGTLLLRSPSSHCFKYIDLLKTMAAFDYQEVINYAFVDPQWQADFAPDIPVITVKNPIAQQMSVMRSTLVPSLLDNLIKNMHRKHSRVRLFECAHTYHPPGKEITKIAGLAYGFALPEQWATINQQVDFFDVKNDVMALLSNKNIHFCSDNPHPILHPGESAWLKIHGKNIGYLGRLHPQWAQKYDIPHPPIVFEIDYNAVCQRIPPHYQPISKYPPIQRDLALIVPKSLLTGQLIQKLTNTKLPELKHIYLFDVYEDEDLLPNQKSLAVKCIFQSQNRTLTNEEINQFIELLLEEAAKLGAKLRDF